MERTPMRIAPRTLLNFKRHHQEQAHKSQYRRGVADVAESEERVRVADHEACVAEADERDEEADAAGDGGVEFVGDGLENHLANPGGGEREEDDAGEKDRAECCLPWHMELDANGVSEVGVESHAWSQRNGITRHDAHHDGGESGGEAGSGSDCGQRHSRRGQNSRVD